MSKKVKTESESSSHEMDSGSHSMLSKKKELIKEPLKDSFVSIEDNEPKESTPEKELEEGLLL
jgi:hypothetical protein